MGEPPFQGNSNPALVHVAFVAGRVSAAMMAGKSMPQQTGAEVARRVVEGKAEFGLTLSGEVASVPGAVIAGPLPRPFGQETTYCAAVMAGSPAQAEAGTLIAALTRPETQAAWARAGFQLPD